MLNYSRIDPTNTSGCEQCNEFKHRFETENGRGVGMRNGYVSQKTENPLLNANHNAKVSRGKYNNIICFNKVL